MIRCLCNDPPVKIQPVRPAVEREPWLRTPDLGREGPDHSGRNIGGIGDDQIKPVRQDRTISSSGS